MVFGTGLLTVVNKCAKIPVALEMLALLRERLGRGRAVPAQHRLILFERQRATRGASLDINAGLERHSRASACRSKRAQAERTQKSGPTASWCIPAWACALPAKRPASKRRLSCIFERAANQHPRGQVMVSELSCDAANRPSRCPPRPVSASHSCRYETVPVCLTRHSCCTAD